MFKSNVVSVGTSATKIGTPPPVPRSALVQNLSAVDVFVGGPDVTTATGFKLPASQTTPVPVPLGVRPGTLDADDALYGVVATGTANVAFLTSL